FLAARVRPFPAVDARRMQRLIRDLDDAEFVVREQACSELKKLGAAASRPLQDALDDKPSLEVRRRIELLLPALAKPTPAQLRALRAVEVLETINTSEARRALASLARGAADSLLTRDARCALTRLSGISQE
ncbi:MAG: WD40 repeat domain-containing protein, partial [Gemmataceae bacterium]